MDCFSKRIKRIAFLLSILTTVLYSSKPFADPVDKALERIANWYGAESPEKFRVNFVQILKAAVLDNGDAAVPGEEMASNWGADPLVIGSLSKIFSLAASTASYQDLNPLLDDLNSLDFEGLEKLFFELFFGTEKYLDTPLEVEVQFLIEIVGDPNALTKVIKKNPNLWPLAIIILLQFADKYSSEEIEVLSLTLKDAFLSVNDEMSFKFRSLLLRHPENGQTLRVLLDKILSKKELKSQNLVIPRTIPKEAENLGKEMLSFRLDPNSNTQKNGLVNPYFGEIGKTLREAKITNLHVHHRTSTLNGAREILKGNILVSEGAGSALKSGAAWATGFYNSQDSKLLKYGPFLIKVELSPDAVIGRDVNIYFGKEDGLIFVVKTAQAILSLQEVSFNIPPESESVTPSLVWIKEWVGNKNMRPQIKKLVKEFFLVSELGGEIDPIQIGALRRLAINAGVWDSQMQTLFLDALESSMHRPPAESLAVTFAAAGSDWNIIMDSTIDIKSSGTYGEKMINDGLVVKLKPYFESHFFSLIESDPKFLFEVYNITTSTLLIEKIKIKTENWPLLALDCEFDKGAVSTFSARELRESVPKFLETLKTYEAELFKRNHPFEMARAFFDLNEGSVLFARSIQSSETYASYVKPVIAGLDQILKNLRRSLRRHQFALLKKIATGKVQLSALSKAEKMILSYNFSANKRAPETLKVLGTLIDSKENPNCRNLLFTMMKNLSSRHI
jgi:hypothetical protein